MNSKKRILLCIGAAGMMLLLILDAKTAIVGASEGVQLCIKTVIPALFPFLILSKIITDATSGQSFPILRPLGKLCGIPNGYESLLLVGLVGGYPVGAKSVYEAYRNSFLKPKDAKRMLSFCSNAGPAFIFGMTASLFQKPWIPWIIWGIHILSAILVGLILPRENSSGCLLKAGKRPELTAAVSQSVATMGIICGWVILFRVIITICQRWLLWLLPDSFNCVLSGILELSNGCIFLSELKAEQIRFIAVCSILAFGGLCVLMQTASVVKELGIASYFKGKLLQTAISFILSYSISPLLFPGTYIPKAMIVILAFAALSTVLVCLKNNSSNTEKLVV